MTKKRIVLVVLSFFLFGVIVVVGINFQSISATVSDKFWNFLAEQLEKEEKAREESKYGGVGKDTIVFLGDGKFQIGKFADDIIFVMYNENKTLETLLRKVTKYEESKNMLYIISDEGYGIVDGKTNVCRLFITVPADEFVNGFAIDAEGEKYYNSRFVEDEHIIYLSSFDEFTNDEKAMFEKMEN